MTEHTLPADDRDRTTDDRTARGTTGVLYPIVALVRDEAAGPRAVAITRRLVRLVSEFDPGSYAAINVRTTDQPGRLELSLEVHGDAADEVSATDLISALGEGIVLGDPVPAGPALPVAVRSAYELFPSRVTSLFRAPADDDARPEWAPADPTDEPGFALPLPHDGDSGEPLLAALARTDRTVWVRTVLAAADELAASMVVDELTASLRHQGVAEYARVPVTARTVVVSPTGVPVAVRAALRQRGSGLRMTPVSPVEADQLWDDPLGAVRAAPVAETHAVAIARIPTAGTMQGLGAPTRRPPVPDRPLDPMPPAPAHPIRLGWATDAFGLTVPVELDASDLLRHCFLEGQPGTGKTTTITQLFWSITRAGYQVIYLDPHGDGAARAAAYSRALDGVTTHYVRHGDRAHPVRMNPIGDADPETRERSLADLLEFIQVMLDPKHEGMVGERFKRTFTIVAQALFELFGPRTSITDVLALTLSKESLRHLAHAVAPRSRDAAARLEAELYSLGDKEFADLVSWFVSRLQPLLRTPALRDILGTGEDSIDTLDVLDSGANLIIDLASLELGEDVARVLGALWLLKVRAAMGRRSSRRPVVLLVDEAHLYTFGALPGMLAEARKFGIGIVVATQTADNLTPQLARAVEGNCGSSISLRTGPTAAIAASNRLGGWSPLHLTRLEDLTAAVSLSRAGVPTPAFTLHVDHFEQVSAHGWDADRIALEAEAAARASHETLWAPHAHRGVLNDAEVVGSVRAAGRAARAPQGPRIDDAPGTPPDERDDSRHRTDSILDRWRDQQERARALRDLAAGTPADGDAGQHAARAGA